MVLETEKIIPLTFGAGIRVSRERLGWTVKELSERSGIPQSSIRRIEGSITEPRLRTFMHLARAFDMPPGELLSLHRLRGEQPK